MQTYWGITPAQAQRSGYPVYTPGLGARDVTLGLGLRSEVHRHWAVLGGVGVTRLIGKAADSPIVQKPTAMSGNVGLVWRF
jgi:outer membrane scaffolding protein for murein synthesis (MipA/OmpV family)